MSEQGRRLLERHKHKREVIGTVLLPGGDTVHVRMPNALEAEQIRIAGLELSKSPDKAFDAQKTILLYLIGDEDGNRAFTADEVNQLSDLDPVVFNTLLERSTEKYLERTGAGAAEKKSTEAVSIG